LDAENLKMTVTQLAAAALSNARWSKIPDSEREQALAKMRAGNRRIPKKKRLEIARLGGAAVKGEKARQRALKAWETKKKKAAEQKNSAA
jgi:hypothetical protein